MKITKKETIRAVPAVALCTLGSLSWGSFKNPEDMRRAARLLSRSLNNILDYQDFLGIHSRLSNEDIRPLGIGVTNLAYWMAKRGLKYGEPDALAEVKEWMEHQAFYLTEMTVELAAERGACIGSPKTRYGQGVFPWELRADGVNELTDFTPSSSLDWEGLRAKMKIHGVRNATQMAIAPVESCQSWRNVLNYANGLRKNFHEMLADHGVDWSLVERTAEPGTEVQLSRPLELSGRSGVEQVTSVIYNGFKPLNTIEFEDGTTMSFTDNHRLLVIRDGEEVWARVFEFHAGDEVVTATGKLLVKNILAHSHEDHTWDVSTPSHTFLLPNGVVSHNSSVVIGSTNGIEMPMKLISTKESKAGSFTQVVPEYHRLKNRYQLMWDQPDCLDYLKTAAVLAAYIDQSISTNTFYSPKNYADGKIPTTLVAKNLMLAHHYGLKTLYYSLIEKQASKAGLSDTDPPTVTTPTAAPMVDDIDDDCLACKL